MLLPDLHIKGYRLFQDLKIERLARVNLIAGENNSGKSSLLEAAYLVANADFLDDYALDNVLRLRGEDVGGGVFAPLFYGYRLFPGLVMEISSGNRRIQCSILGQEATVKALAELSGFREHLAKRKKPELVMEVKPTTVAGAEGQGFLLWGEDGERVVRLYDSVPNLGSEPALMKVGTALLSSQFQELRRLWDGISLTPQVDNVVRILRVIEPRVKGLDFLRERDAVKVLLEGEERPVLLGSLGDGMRHLLTIALQMVSARGGVLLIDEVETGLHYTTLVDLWQLIFQVAESLDVQVLATTHSWDCIAAFSKAWNETNESAGLFLRLSRRTGQIRPVTYTAEELDIAVKHEVEVR